MQSTLQADLELLGVLASNYRRTRDEAERARLASEYAVVVHDLVQNHSGEWTECPPPEDQLPDEHMPPEFDRFWYDEAAAVAAA